MHFMGFTKYIFVFFLYMYFFFLLPSLSLLTLRGGNETDSVLTGAVCQKLSLQLASHDVDVINIIKR